MKRAKAVSASATRKTRGKNSKLVYSAVVGNNSDLIKRVGRLYLRRRRLVADVTYGHGVFWRQITFGHQQTLIRSDVRDDIGSLRKNKRDPHANGLLVRCDFRALPYRDGSLDVVVLDPPYAHQGGERFRYNKSYNNAKTTPNFNHAKILGVYARGIREVARVLKPGGLLWVKGQDEIESGIHRRSSLELLYIAERLGFLGHDLFILVRPRSDNAKRRRRRAPSAGRPPAGGDRKPRGRRNRQLHAWSNYSFLWIFKKADTRGKREIAKDGVVATLERLEVICREVEGEQVVTNSAATATEERAVRRLVTLQRHASVATGEGVDGSARACRG